MSSPSVVVCPSCYAEVAPGSAFCTRCGAGAQSMTVISPVLGGAQQWGGVRRRDRRGGAAQAGGSPDVGQPVGVFEGLPDGRRGAGAEHGASGAGTSVYLEPGAAFAGVAPAGVTRRLGAYALDLVVVLVAAGVAFRLTGGPLYGALIAAEVAVGLVVWEARCGRTFGNTLLGLRTAKEETPYAPGLGRAVGRALVLGACHLAAGVGQWFAVASSGFDRSGRGQGWHDRVAGTLVVDVRGLRVAGGAVATSGPRPSPEAALTRAPVSGRLPASEPAVAPAPEPVQVLPPEPVHEPRLDRLLASASTSTSTSASTATETAARSAAPPTAGFAPGPVLPPVGQAALPVRQVPARPGPVASPVVRPVAEPPAPTAASPAAAAGAQPAPAAASSPKPPPPGPPASRVASPAPLAPGPRTQSRAHGRTCSASTTAARTP